MQGIHYQQEGAQELLTAFTARTRHMPMVMNSVFPMIAAYLEGRFDRAQFLEFFLDRNASLAQLVAFRRDREAYTQNYAQELAFLRATADLCSDPQRPDFDARLTTMIQRFLETPPPKKHFIK